MLLAVGLLLLVPAARADAAPARCGGLTVTVDLAQGDVPTAGDDVIAGTPGRDVVQAGAGDDVVCGRGGKDVIRLGPGADRGFGGGGADHLAGGAGDDWLEGGAARDRQLGGPGVDSCEFETSTDDGCEAYFIID